MQYRIKLSRPVEFLSAGDDKLMQVIEDLVNYFPEIQSEYDGDALEFNVKQIIILSKLIVEFAEDLHNDIGLWRAIEEYNTEMFSTPLPLFVKNSYEIKEVFDKNRIKFFIYNILHVLLPKLILAPKHQDLDILSDRLSDFLKRNFKEMPKDSCVKKFLSQSNIDFREFKKKLFWVSTESYLFRNIFKIFMKNKNKDIGDIANIADIDSFLCQKNTIWSVLGITDILARVLKLPRNLQNDVHRWYELYTSLYVVLAYKKNILKLKNIVNDTIYDVYFDIPDIPFKPSELVFGSLVPYGKYWHWSGIQNKFGMIDDVKTSDLINEIIKTSPYIVYRYDKKRLQEAIKQNDNLYNSFIKYFGNDLAVFNNGRSMAMALQQMQFQRNEELAIQQNDEKRKVSIELSKNDFTKNIDSLEKIFPKNILESQVGVGVFYNKKEGKEIWVEFNDLKNAFMKEGINLTPDEKFILISFIITDTISPEFVYRMVEDYGVKSIQQVLLLNTEENNLDYLMHKYKGEYFRNRYPRISIVD
jgi:hypothetical protein